MITTTATARITATASVGAAAEIVMVGSDYHHYRYGDRSYDGRRSKDDYSRGGKGLRGRFYGNNKNKRKQMNMKHMVMEEGAITTLAMRAQFDDEDFTLDLAGLDVTPQAGGTVQGGNLANWPALDGQGLSVALFNLEPCGINLPHVHPRASELVYAIDAKKLLVAFSEENGGRGIENKISTGMTTFFPEGLVHFQQNLSCENAKYVAFLNSEDPGIVTITTAGLANLPIESVADAFGVSTEEAKMLVEGFPPGPASGMMSCLKRCGIYEDKVKGHKDPDRRLLELREEHVQRQLEHWPVDERV
ncbi:unnamed protein product [Chrysoparadoxa australica]